MAVALLVGGFAFLAAERLVKDKALHNEVTWTMAAAVGVGQLVAAVFPGTSRSGATIVLMLLLGLSRVAATEFTFLVGIPTILASGGLKIVKALHHPAPDAPVENWPMVAFGFLVSAVISFIVVRWLLRYVQTHTFTAFGLYRIAVAGLIFGLILVG